MRQMKARTYKACHAVDVAEPGLAESHAGEGGSAKHLQCSIIVGGIGDERPQVRGNQGDRLEIDGVGERIGVARDERFKRVNECIEAGVACDVRRNRAERERIKEELVGELTELFAASGQIRNVSKFRKDFVARERKSSTAIGGGFAVPHVRSSQPRKLVLIFARSAEGVWFDAEDGGLVHFFFGITVPEYEDQSLYLDFYRWSIQIFRDNPWLSEALLAARDEHEIIALLSGLRE